MSCNHGCHAFDTGFKTPKGKAVLKLCSRDVKWIYLPKYENRPFSQKPNEVYLDHKITNYIEVPCGKCKECRLNYARQWADRCMLEAKEYKNNYFITLTYDDGNLPMTTGVERTTGELTQVPTLNVKDLQDFMKRLRITWERKHGCKNIRNYSCGEYGDKGGRPHYHAILFNLPIFDLELHHVNKNEERIYTSKEIEEVWGNGFIGIGEVNWETCCYTARYIMKKQKGEGAKEYYKILNIQPEFTIMSRRPGIAREYYNKNKETIYKTDEIFLTTKKGSQTIKPARYFDRLYDLEKPEELKKLKRTRQKIAKVSMQNQLRKTDLTEQEYRDLKEESKNLQIEKLKRMYDKKGGE